MSKAICVHLSLDEELKGRLKAMTGRTTLACGRRMTACEEMGLLEGPARVEGEDFGRVVSRRAKVENDGEAMFILGISEDQRLSVVESV